MTNQHISRLFSSDSSVIGYSDEPAVKCVSHRPSLNPTLCACVETPSSAVFRLSCGARQNNVAYLVALQWARTRGLCCHWDGTFYNVAVGPLSLIDQSHRDFMRGLTSPVKTPQSTQLFFRAMFPRPQCVQTLASLWLPDVKDESLIISYC